ncbi:hypothetical protein LRS05_05795 [Flavobacterium sp. J372]|uniref:hypothetical protein n=1 Tax=Flavobacterium sp. J372 TaxID=2898436 RepID=UPI002151BB3B|nr:hypothetical protein [Flavobacterium sp. J372]MCR5861676.1 hypothetical protein [Flavobacterium sp. J372]
MRGLTVRIIVHEPKSWDKNLFGTILYDRGGDRLLIKLSKPLKDEELETDLIVLKPANDKETFKPLLQNYSVIAHGSLTDEDNTTSEPILYGSVTVD